MGFDKGCGTTLQISSYFYSLKKVTKEHASMHNLFENYIIEQFDRMRFSVDYLDILMILKVTGYGLIFSFQNLRNNFFPLHDSQSL
jgi:hypothetical protein